ncbi:MAG: hypothetical protein JWN88_368 [Frankiales bacterium]|nr:hypothetical protein [Frankiales bacterium]
MRVQASLDAGDLSEVRMASWRHLQRELAWQARRTEARLRQQEKQRRKTIHLQQRAGRGRRA